MDLHPTPFPGKRRPPSSASTKKLAGQPPPSKTPATATAAAPPPASSARPKRAFGVPRTTNIPIQRPKPTLTKPRKPWNPPGTLAKARRKDAPPPQAPVSETLPVSASGGSGESRTAPKKNCRVAFQDLVQDGKDDGVQTPAPSIEPGIAAGTPYLSAHNCSKCRLDRLELASYWLSQIKLSESVGKHSVSAAFFRLALDCHAQPSYRLQSEIKHYVARHGSVVMDALWKDLYNAYGLSDGQFDACAFNLNEIDDAFLEKEIIDCKDHDEASCRISKDGSVEGPPFEHVIDISSSELKENTGIDKSVESKRISTSVESLSITHKAIPKGEGKSSARNVSGKKAHGEKCKGVSFLSPNDSSCNSKAKKSGGSTSKGNGTPSRSREQPGLRIAGGKLRSGNGASPKMNQNGGLRNQHEAYEKVTGTDLIGNLDSDRADEDPTRTESHCQSGAIQLRDEL